ncbi:cell division protein FtsZ [Candidatus Bathyarchaeota archaeon]|nr:cell division protein FtsZ [Candidatus Bathyarchaeota archaeon]
MTRPVNRVLQFTWNEATREGIREPGYCRILVLGIGGAGNNTISRLKEMGITGAECIAINTDMQHLNATHVNHTVLIGEKTTQGLGAGGNPEVGRAAIEESRKKLEEILTDIDIVFVTAGLGGGTGTGAAPMVAEIAHHSGAIVVGVVTTPFRIERGRIECAARGLNEMRRQCDTVVVIDNNKLMELVPQLPLNEAFKVADQVLANMIKGVVETISAPSLINLDFADFKTIVRKGGVAVVGVGESDAPNRAEEAVQNALRSPLLDVDYAGATGALIHVCGGNRMTIEEANRVGEIVTEMMANNASVIWGARVSPSLEDVLRVTLVMTGVNSSNVLRGFGTMAPQLFDIDPCEEPEEPLPIDLGLDQIENFE